MHKLYELKEKLMRELEDYSENGKFSKEDVEAIKYITSSIDHICNIVEGEEYSNAGGGSYNAYNGGMGGSSYRRGGSYARGGRGGRSNRGGSYAYGYSRAGEDLAEQLRELMQDAPDERVRSEIERLAAKVEKM